MFCEKAWAAVCQQQNPEAEVLVTDGTIAVVAIDTVQLMSVDFGPIDMLSVPVLTDRQSGGTAPAGRNFDREHYQQLQLH